MPVLLYTGGTTFTSAGCMSTCTPAVTLWLEPEAVTHIGPYSCMGVC